MTAYFNGHFIAEEDVSLHVTDLAIQRGYAIFDFFRLIGQQPLFMNDYLDRFFNSAGALQLEVGLSREELQSVIYELIARNQLPDSGIKIILTGGYSDDGYLPASPNLIIMQHPMKARPASLVTDGMKIITHEHVRELPEIKSVNYLTGVRLQSKLRDAGAADVLYHLNSIVSEFPRSNFFIVTKDETVVTPSENVLRGITRKKTLELAAKHFRVEERVVTIDDIRNAKEAFATSTSKQIVGVVQVDEVVLSDGKPGSVTRFLDQEFQKLVHSNTELVY